MLPAFTKYGKNKVDTRLCLVNKLVFSDRLWTFVLFWYTYAFLRISILMWHFLNKNKNKFWCKFMTYDNLLFDP